MQEIGVTPYKVVAISVPGFYVGGGILAGVNKLLVDGVPSDGFCIDPFHWSIGVHLRLAVRRSQVEEQDRISGQAGRRRAGIDQGRRVEGMRREIAARVAIAVAARSATL